MLANEPIRQFYRDIVFFVSVPDACRDGGCGLIVDVHGAHMSADQQDRETGLRSLGAVAVARGASTPYVVVQPQAAGNPPMWDDAEAETIHAFASCLVPALDLDERRLHLGGFSKGAYLTAYAVCGNPGTFASVSAIAGGADIFAECLFLEEASSPPLLYIHGRADFVAPFASAQRLHAATERAMGETQREQLAPDRWRYVTGKRHVEFIFHDDSGGLVGAHCVPGGEGSLGCASERTAGEEIIDFYIRHPKP